MLDAALGVQGQCSRGASVLAQCETEIRGLPDTGHRAWRLTLVAEGFASCGHPERAARLLAEAEAEGRKVSDPEKRAEHLTEVGEALTACGDHMRAGLLLTEAAEIGRALPSSSGRDHRLGSVGMALVLTGAHQEAEELAADIDTPHLKVRVLTALAGTVAPAWARRLVAQCLLSASWGYVLDGLAVAGPSALVAVADEEYGGEEHGSTGHRGRE